MILYQTLHLGVHGLSMDRESDYKITVHFDSRILGVFCAWDTHL